MSKTSDIQYNKQCLLVCRSVVADRVSFDDAVARRHFIVIDSGLVDGHTPPRTGWLGRLGLRTAVLRRRRRVSVGAVPDVGQTETGMEAVEEQQWQVDIGE